MNPSKLSALTLALLAVHAAADSPADTVHNQDGELQTVHVSGKKKAQRRLHRLRNVHRHRP
ncbi:hypothetical protein OP500_09075 [Kingella sp. SNUBH-2017]|uniref:hypothetical protein n=1 Tax=Kingella sp. SNUBH-2017 TaxID=2994077 RepID=UPI0023648F28|nr:hypothetical protein [Kingella sp. SNUBH-2017]MDD2183453.1 hypothetical protein [Kingella sp. SNUBH-2017]